MLDSNSAVATAELQSIDNVEVNNSSVASDELQDQKKTTIAIVGSEDKNSTIAIELPTRPWMMCQMSKSERLCLT